MPHIPEVGVTLSHTVFMAVFIGVAPLGCGVVSSGRRMCLHGLRQHAMEQRLITGAQGLAIAKRSTVDLHQLVIPTPHGNASPVAQPPQLVLGLVTHAVQKLGVAWVQGASKHKVLPHQQSEFIAQIIKIFTLIHTTAPHPHAIHMRQYRCVQVTRVVVSGQVRHKRMGGNPIGPFDKNRNAIHHKLEFLASVVRRLVQHHRA